MNRRDSILVYLLYALLGIFYILSYRNQLSASDTIFYMMSARELAEGNLWEGINSYWGMLFSVLMVPFFWMGFKGLLAVKIVQFLTGCFALWQSLKLFKKFDLRGWFTYFAIILLVLLIWMMSMSHTPDLLIVGLLLLYFNTIYSDDYKISSLLALKCGIIGALLYFCKGYGLPFFLVHFTVWNLFLLYDAWRKETDSSEVIVNNLINGLTIFIFLCGSWILILSTKYGEFTTGSSGTYNWNYMGPEMNFTPPYFDRFHNPETEFTSYFIGEEQGLFGDYGKWNLFQNFDHFLERIRANVSKLYYITFLRDLVFLLFVTIVLLIVKKVHIPEKVKGILLPLVFFLFVYDVGYFLLFPNERYIWINHVLLGVLLIRLIQSIWEQTKIQWMGAVLLGATIVLLSINIQDRILLRTDGNDFYNSLKMASPEIQSLDMEGKSIISNIRPADPMLIDYMDPTCLLMYQEGFKIWGFIQTKTLKQMDGRQLQIPEVDYFFLWEGDEVRNKLDQYREVLRLEDIGLRIYEL